MGTRAVAQEADPDASLPQYRFRLDSTSIMLGDQTVLSIAKTPVYPSLDDLTNNDIVAVRQWMDTTDGTLYTALTSFEPGEHWLHIGSDSVMLTVNDVSNVDTTTANIRDIADIMKQPYTFGEIARAVLCFWAFWAVVALAVFIFIRVKSRKPLISLPQAPPLPPDTRALQRLESLRQRQLWQQGMVKEYYTEENAMALGQILQAADMVKFAKSTPQPYQHDMALNQSTQFIKNTAALNPKPESPDTDEGQSTDSNIAES